MALLYKKCIYFYSLIEEMWMKTYKKKQSWNIAEAYIPKWLIDTAFWLATTVQRSQYGK